MAALHKKYIRERATEKENPDDEFFVKNFFVCGEVAKANQVTIAAAANGGGEWRRRSPLDRRDGTAIASD